MNRKPLVLAATILLTLAFGMLPAQTQEPAPASVQSETEDVLFLHAVANPTATPDCAGAPFTPEIVGVEDLYTSVVPSNDGAIRIAFLQKAGTATSCGRWINQAGGLSENFVKIEVNGLSFQALGPCQRMGRLATGAAIANCAMNVQAPAAGLLTTNSVLNLRGLDPNYARSDCYWTLRLFK